MPPGPTRHLSCSGAMAISCVSCGGSTPCPTRQDIWTYQNVFPDQLCDLPSKFGYRDPLGGGTPINHSQLLFRMSVSPGSTISANSPGSPEVGIPATAKMGKHQRVTEDEDDECIYPESHGYRFTDVRQRWFIPTKQPSVILP